MGVVLSPRTDDIGVVRKNLEFFMYYYWAKESGLLLEFRFKSIM